jgi:hypothetical protein
MSEKESEVRRQSEEFASFGPPRTTSSSTRVVVVVVILHIVLPSSSTSERDQIQSRPSIASPSRPLPATASRDAHQPYPPTPRDIRVVPLPDRASERSSAPDRRARENNARENNARVIVIVVGVIIGGVDVHPHIVIRASSLDRARGHRRPIIHRIETRRRFPTTKTTRQKHTKITHRGLEQFIVVLTRARGDGALRGARGRLGDNLDAGERGGGHGGGEHVGRSSSVGGEK